MPIPRVARWRAIAALPRASFLWYTLFSIRNSIRMISKRARPTTRKPQVKAGAGRRVGAGGADMRYLVPALDRGLQILQTLSGERRKLSLS